MACIQISNKLSNIERRTVNAHETFQNKFPASAIMNGHRACIVHMYTHYRKAWPRSKQSICIHALAVCVCVCVNYCVDCRLLWRRCCVPNRNWFLAISNTNNHRTKLNSQHTTLRSASCGNGINFTRKMKWIWWKVTSVCSAVDIVDTVCKCMVCVRRTPQIY